MVIFEKSENQSVAGSDKAPPHGTTLADASTAELKSTPRGDAGLHQVTIDDHASKSPQDKTLNLYDQFVHDDKREANFKNRLDSVAKTDPEAAKDFAALDKKLSGFPPATPGEVGADLGDLYTKALQRQSANGAVDLESAQNTTLMGAMSGYMLAASAGMSGDASDRLKQTTEMVDAVESKIQKAKLPYAHAIIWGDTKEPGMAVISPNSTKEYDRYNFSE